MISYIFYTVLEIQMIINAYVLYLEERYLKSKKLDFIYLAIMVKLHSACD